MPIEETLTFLGFRGAYNTAIVLAGATALGIAAGMVGVFPLLRRRALVSDAVSHATLPGIVIGFLVAGTLGDGRNLHGLMIGAAATALLGALAVHWIRTRTRLPEDTAIASVLGVFFGLGVVLLTHVQTLRTGNAAGLDDFLLGSIASLTANEALTIGAGALVVALLTTVFLKEFSVLAFDATHAAVQGLSVSRLDLAILGLVVAVVAIGLKTVGLVLIIALIIIPPSTARLWTSRLVRMTALSAIIGGLSGWTGVWVSAVLPDVPTGPAIVLVAGAFFGLSLLFAPTRGIIAWGLTRRKLRTRMARVRILLTISEGALPMDRQSRAAALRWGYMDRAGRVTPAGSAAARSLARVSLSDLTAVDHVAALSALMEQRPDERS